MPLADQRTEVLARIREGLRVPAPHRHVPHFHADDAHPVAEAVEGLPDPESFRAWLPAVGANQNEQIALFARNSAGLKTEFFELASLEEAAAHLAQLAKEAGWKRVATHRHEQNLTLAEKLALPTLITDAGYAVAELEQCDAAITGCDALVAQTGSVLVTTASAGGRALSVLPPHHVVIARRAQMVPDLATALHQAAARYASNWPSFLSFITGPSRTGDIERILVLGAHGPKRLTVLMLP